MGHLRRIENLSRKFRMAGSASTFSVVSTRRGRELINSSSAVRRIAVRPPAVMPFSSSGANPGLRYSLKRAPSWNPTPAQNDTPTIAALR